MKSVLAAVLAAACATALPVHAQRAMFAAGTAAEAKRLSSTQRQERRFLQDAASLMRLQQQAAKLALARSAHGAVRELAAALLNHANMAQGEVQYLLHARGMAMPMPTPEETRLLRELGRAQGARFDRLFLEQVAWRSNDVGAAQYERIAAVTQDAQLLGWVQRHQGALRYHASLAARALPAPKAAAPGPLL